MQLQSSQMVNHLHVCTQVQILLTLMHLSICEQCRAPGVVDAGPSVETLAEYHLTPEEQKAQQGRKSVAVAVRDQHLLATAFHPELTSDLRW